jgi:hypothetical protein
MAGYGVQERKTCKSTKPQGYTCGVCGSEVSRKGMICLTCKDDIFFQAVCVQVETEKG